jgi:hypothetical protein
MVMGSGMACQNPTAGPAKPSRILAMEVNSLVDRAMSLDKAAEELREKVYGPAVQCDPIPGSIPGNSPTEVPTLASEIERARVIIANVTSLLWDIAGRLA